MEEKKVIPTRLSVVIITFNEEKNIERCLQSVKGLAEEVIVVDSFSKDRTREICMAYQVQFMEHVFEGYIEQKTYALAQASGPFVLCLDADEAVSAELARSVLEEKKLGFPARAYSVNRRNNYCGQWINHGTYYPDRKLRLFAKALGDWGGTNPHDRVILKEPVQPRVLKGDLLHYTYQSFEEHARKMEQFSTIAAQELYRKGKPANYFKLVINPAWGFFYAYFIRQGFRDGRNGFMIARLNAWQKYLKYRKLVQLNRGK